MENKNYYTIKEVFAGLVPAQRQNQELLGQLKPFVEVTDKKVLDYMFYLFYSTFRKCPELRMEVQDKPRFIKDKFAQFLNSFSLYPGINYEDKMVECLTSNSGDYHLVSPHYDFYISYENQDEFRRIAKEILTSDFAMNLKLYEFEAESDEPGVIAKGCIRLNNPSVRTYIGNKFTLIRYTPQLDEVEMLSTIPTSEHFLKCVLPQIHFSRESFCEYHRSLIENARFETPEDVLFEGETTIIKDSSFTRVRVKYPRF